MDAFLFIKRCLTLTMIKKYLALIILTAAIFSCSNSDQKKTAVTDIDVATAFVRALLDNDFKEAEQYLYKDETNTQIFERFKKQYSGKDKATLEKYKEAQIIVNETNVVKPDSIFIFNHRNHSCQWYLLKINLNL